MHVDEARADLDPHVDDANALAEWFQARGVSTYDSIRVFAIAITSTIVGAKMPFDTLCEAVGTELAAAYVELTTPGLGVLLETFETDEPAGAPEGVTLQ